MTLTKEHYEYLANTIINDPDITRTEKAKIYNTLKKWFIRDFRNFNEERWLSRWNDHFHPGLPGSTAR